MADLDSDRLPFVKFNTRNLVMAFATLSYNLLRLKGQRLTKERTRLYATSQVTSPENCDAGNDEQLPAPWYTAADSGCRVLVETARAMLCSATRI